MWYEQWGTWAHQETPLYKNPKYRQLTKLTRYALFPE